MSEREHEPGGGVFDLDSPDEVLAYARASRELENAAAVASIRAAARWAAMHSADSLVEQADWTHGTERAMPMGGPGCPEVAEFAVAELAAALGMSTEAGRRYLGEVLELRYRLPRLWCHLEAGMVPAWQARRVAQHTMLLSADAARFVDAKVWWCVQSVGPAQLDRLVDEAVQRFDPERAEALARQRNEGLRFEVGLDAPGVATGGPVPVEGCLDLADARDLDLALRQEAQELKALGSTDSLDVRRAQAVGVLARRQLTLDLNGGETSKAIRPRQVTWHVHTTDELKASGLVRVEETGGFISVEQLRSWLGPDTQLTVKPVIDLREHISVDRYEIPDRLAEQVNQRYPRCVHPHCNRRARRCDHDHLVAHADGGPTCSCNVVPLCRFHHRLKTHGGWSYYQLHPGAFVWRSPHGHQYLVNQYGTHALRPSVLPDR